MSRSLTLVTTVLLVCLVLAVSGALIWANTHFLHTQPVEEDFLVPWLAARTFIQYGDSPYSVQATQRAQVIYYGQLASESQDPLILWLPFPVELFYFPFALVPDYILARAIWMTCNEFALIAMAFLCLQLADWKLWRGLMPVFLIYPILWVFGAMSLVSGNASSFIALALTGFLLALRREQDELAGGLLILLIGALRLTGILSLFMIWWLIHQRRWRVFWGFIMGATVLMGLTFLFLPDWFVGFFSGLVSHLMYNPGFSTTRIFALWSPVVGQRLGWVLAALLLLVLFFEWGSNLSKDFRSFLWMVSLTLSATPLLGIPMLPNEFSFLFIPLTLLGAVVAERKPLFKFGGFVGIGLLIIMFGPWILTIYLVKANLLSALTLVLFFLLPVLLMIGLLWIRWWFTHTMPIGLEYKS